MLILQRKKEQSLKIGDNITIRITDVGNDWVKLAIDAPRDVPIVRTELLEAASANQEAVSIPLNADSISMLKNLINEKKSSGNT